MLLVKELPFSEDIYQRFDWQQPGYAKHVADWGCKWFQIFTQKLLLGNIKYFVSFKLKSLKSNGFRQNIILSKN